MRKLATAVFAFSAGIFLAQYFLPLPVQLYLALGALVLAGLSFFYTGRTRWRMVLIYTGLAAALLWNWGYLRTVCRPAQALSGETQTLTMTVCREPQATDYGAKATVTLTCGDYRGQAVYYGGAELLELVPGNTVTDMVELRDAGNIQDEEITTFTSKGVFVLAYSRGTPTYETGTASSWRWWPERAATLLRTQIGRLFTGDEAAFLIAMLTGDRSGLSEQASSDLSEAGIYHIFAVSGLHCAFLLSLVIFLVGRHRRRLVAAIAVPVLIFYAVLAGATPSVVRACTMLIALLLAPLLRREGDAPTALGCALAGILACNPFAAASISLQLSFAAMGGILWLTPKLYGWLTRRRPIGRIWGFVSLSVSTTLGAMVFTAPLCAYYFQTFCLVSPLTNLLCLWAASLLFACGLLAVLGSWVWLPLGTVLGLVPRLLIRYLLTASHLLARIPYHAVYFSNPYLKYWLVVAYLLFGVAYLLRGRQKRQYFTAGVLAALTLCLTLTVGRNRFTAGSADLVALNVGQGESVVLASEGTFLLADCGSSNRWISTGDLAADQLQSMGCGRLDYLLLTHYDWDHISGVEELLARIPVETVLLPEAADDAGLRQEVTALAEEAGAELRFLSQEVSVTLGAMEVTVYPPLGSGGDNERGLSLLATSGDFDFLLTGDMGSATEQVLLERYALPDIEVLLVGHHGSAGATSTQLLQTLRPEAAILSVGENSYGHPREETLLRLVAAGAEIYRTDQQGNIHISVN